MIKNIIPRIFRIFIIAGTSLILFYPPSLAEPLIENTLDNKIYFAGAGLGSILPISTGYVNFWNYLKLDNILYAYGDVQVGWAKITPSGMAENVGLVMGDFAVGYPVTFDQETTAPYLVDKTYDVTTTTYKYYDNTIPEKFSVIPYVGGRALKTFNQDAIRFWPMAGVKLLWTQESLPTGSSSEQRFRKNDYINLYGAISIPESKFPQLSPGVFLDWKFRIGLFEFRFPVILGIGYMKNLDSYSSTNSIFDDMYLKLAIEFDLI